MDSYSHTQKAPLCLLLYGSGLVLLAVAIYPRQQTALTIVFLAAGVLNTLMAMSFHHLHVSDLGSRLAIRFGPIPLFRRNLPYDAMDKVEVGRTLLLDGWGIHYSIRGGWVWNLWGRDCVVVHFKKGNVLRIGTDDADNLARFLEEKVSRPV